MPGDEHGRFEKRITLPGDLQPGDYTLIAAGDKKATAKLEVGVAPWQETAVPEEEKRAR